MAKNRGKQFESKFKEDFLKTVPNSTIDRLYDVVTGYKAITQVSDFIGYSKPCIFYLECKSHAGASIPFVNITQYEKLLPKVGIPGVRCGIILWLTEKDKVLYIPVSTIKIMKEKGEKSVGIRSLNDYRIIEIPSIKKRTFLDSDYSVLLNLKDGE